MIWGIVIISVAVAGAVAFAVKRSAVKAELNVILADLDSTVNKLETFVADKEIQIADHLEEIALHNNHVNLKTADQERAKRISAKLNELLA